MAFKELKINFSFKRYRRIHKYMDYVMLIAFVIFAGVALLHIPFIGLESDIEIKQAINNNLENQLKILESEFVGTDGPTRVEINYSNAYVFINDQVLDVPVYVQNILDSRLPGIQITSILFNVNQKTVRVIVNTSSEVLVNEFIINAYETYGVISGSESPTRWIQSFPERSSITGSVVEVTFRYA